jgi:hypothetical protein
MTSGMAGRFGGLWFQHACAAGQARQRLASLSMLHTIKGTL